MDLHLNECVALVTGAASGIGRACVNTLLGDGARVVLVDLDAAGVQITDDLRQQGHQVHFVHADITNEADVERTIKETLDNFGQLDSVVGSAGISGPVGTLAADVSVADWDRVMAVNVKGNFLIAKHSIPLLARSDVGTIVFIASDSALVAFEGMSPYSTSKGAVLMLTKALAVDHPEIRVNCLCPGVVDTPMSRGDLSHPEGFAHSNLPVATPTKLPAMQHFSPRQSARPINATSLVADFGYLGRSALPPLEFTK